LDASTRFGIEFTKLAFVFLLPTILGQPLKRPILIISDRLLVFIL
jgi:hypothetical protein